MQEIEKRIANLPHHAFLVQGDPSLATDVFVTFGIDDAHVFARRQSLQAAEGETQVFYIGAHGFTIESQNALLKTIEEPAPGSRFIIITPYPDDLLPTLRSRLYILDDFEDSASDVDVFDAAKFLAKTPLERLKYLEKSFFDVRDESDEVHARTKYDAGAILSTLELYYQKNTKKVDDASFELLERCKGYIHDTSPAVKLMLESLALHLPMV